MLFNFLTDILAVALLGKYVMKSQNTTLAHDNDSFRNFSDSELVLEHCILQSGRHTHGPTIHSRSKAWSVALVSTEDMGQIPALYIISL